MALIKRLKSVRPSISAPKVKTVAEKVVNKVKSVPQIAAPKIAVKSLPKIEVKKSVEKLKGSVSKKFTKNKLDNSPGEVEQESESESIESEYNYNDSETNSGESDED